MDSGSGCIGCSGLPPPPSGASDRIGCMGCKVDGCIGCIGCSAIGCIRCPCSGPCCPCCCSGCGLKRPSLGCISRVRPASLHESASIKRVKREYDLRWLALARAREWDCSSHRIRVAIGREAKHDDTTVPLASAQWAGQQARGGAVRIVRTRPFTPRTTREAAQEESRSCEPLLGIPRRRGFSKRVRWLQRKATAVPLHRHCSSARRVELLDPG